MLNHKYVKSDLWVNICDQFNRRRNNKDERLITIKVKTEEQIWGKVEEETCCEKC